MNYQCNLLILRMSVLNLTVIHHTTCPEMTCLFKVRLDLSSSRKCLDMRACGSEAGLVLRWMPAKELAVGHEMKAIEVRKKPS